MDLVLPSCGVSVCAPHAHAGIPPRSYTSPHVADAGSRLQTLRAMDSRGIAWRGTRSLCPLSSSDSAGARRLPLWAAQLVACLIQFEVVGREQLRRLLRPVYGRSVDSYLRPFRGSSSSSQRRPGGPTPHWASALDYESASSWRCDSRTSTSCAERSESSTRSRWSGEDGRRRRHHPHVGPCRCPAWSPRRSPSTSRPTRREQMVLVRHAGGGAVPIRTAPHPARRGGPPPGRRGGPPRTPRENNNASVLLAAGESVGPLTRACGTRTPPWGAARATT